MLSNQIKKYYDEGRIDELYKECKKYFDLIDYWADKMIDGDLLNEYELSKAMEQCNGCQTKLNPIAGCLESMVVEYESRYEIQNEEKFKKEGKFTKVQQDSSRYMAREQVSDLRRYATDFTRYSYSAQNTVVVSQSRLKRLSVEKANKGVDYTGEVPQTEQPSLRSNPTHISCGEEPRELKDAKNKLKNQNKSNGWV